MEKKKIGLPRTRGQIRAMRKAEDRLLLKKQGKLRIKYTVNRSSVQYITSADRLPNYEELAQYDDAYFEKHALLLVVESVRSGSVDTGILSVSIEEDCGAVTLYHEMPQGAANTSDMATWLLWAEVEPGLECRWSVVNPALRSATAAY